MGVGHGSRAWESGTRVGNDFLGRASRAAVPPSAPARGAPRREWQGRHRRFPAPPRHRRPDRPGRFGPDTRGFTLQRSGTQLDAVGARTAQLPRLPTQAPLTTTSAGWRSRVTLVARRRDQPSLAGDDVSHPLIRSPFVLDACLAVWMPTAGKQQRREPHDSSVDEIRDRSGARRGRRDARDWPSALHGTLTSLLRFDKAVPRWCARHERVEQPVCGGRNFIDRPVERGLVRFRRFRRSTELPHELQRRRANLVVRGGRFEVGEHLDVAAHPSILGSQVLHKLTRGRRKAAVTRLDPPQ